MQVLLIFKISGIWTVILGGLREATGKRIAVDGEFGLVVFDWSFAIELVAINRMIILTRNYFVERR